MEQILLHPRTRRLIDTALRNKTQGILLEGDEGAGKKYLALNIASQLIGLESIVKLASYPYFACIDPSEPSVTIDDIRAMKRLLTLKAPTNPGRKISRVIVIIDAERMRAEAQNALLKTLEEPPADTCLILTAKTSSSLLPTITSRLQPIPVMPVNQALAVEYFKAMSLSETSISSAQALAKGNVGLISGLLKEENHDLRLLIAEAKEILSLSLSQRVALIDDISKEKAHCLAVCDALQRIAHAALLQAGKQSKVSAITRWRSILAATESAKASLNSNANNKLVLDELFFAL